MGSDKRKRSESIHIRVTPEEKEALQMKANLYGVGSLSDYLRSVGLAHTLRSKFDADVVKKLVKIGADFGRVGGLIKLFIAQREHRYSADDFQTMDRFIKELDMTRGDIAAAIKKVIR